MNANYRYFVTFDFDINMPINELNKAFNCNIKNNLDEYVTEEFKLSLDEDFVYVCFKSIKNKKNIKTIINKVANTICSNAYFSTFDFNDDDDD